MRPAAAKATTGLESEVLLRAEIRAPSETIVALARELTDGSVIVVTEWRPPIGTLVRLRISFPSLLPAVDLSARVVEHQAPAGVGSPARLKFVFEFDNEPEREVIKHVVERVRSVQPVGSSARPYRVLLVEDNAFIGDMFRYGISKFFAERRQTGQIVECEYAPDAASAWQMLEGSRYDMVVVDYYLPLEDGAALIARLRRDERYASTPVLAISVGGRDARDATMSAGADLFLDKPVVLRDLLRTLQVLAQRGAEA
jgi:CheY-like chemotaxis protein